MTRILRLALASVLMTAFAVPAPVSAAVKMDCCGESCPMPSKKSPAKAAKCCQVAPAEKKESATPLRLPVVSRTETVSIVAPVLRPVFVVAVLAVPPACVFDEAPSGLSPPAARA